MKRIQQDVKRALDTVLSGASHDPALFNRVVNASKGDATKVKRKLTVSMAFVLILVLMSSTVALAAAYRGVSWFLTERTTQPITINPDQILSNLTQDSTSEWLDAHVQDAYWDGSVLSVSIRVTTKDAAFPFALEYDIGADGESFDMIWLSDAEGNPNQMSVAAWLNGHTGILLRAPEITVEAAAERVQWTSLDCIHELAENAVVMMIQIPVNDLSQGSQVVITLDSVKCYPADGENAAAERWLAQEPGETESATLTVTLPALDAPVSYETMRPGDEGEAVADLQTRLHALNLYDGEISGVYDDATMQAVKAFQRENGLVADGVCGMKTIELLFK